MLNKARFTTDYEPYTGRKTYAENCVGGYYAARLPILEKLKDIIPEKRIEYFHDRNFIQYVENEESKLER